MELATINVFHFISGIIENVNIIFCNECSNIPQSSQKSEKYFNTNHFLCKLCNKVFESLLLLKFHMKIHIDENNFVCVECADIFTRKELLDDHVKKHETQRNCHRCNKPFTLETKSKESKPYKCKTCNVEFTEFEAIHNYTVKLHEGDRPLPCEECNRRSKEVGRLRRRKKVYEKQKPEACEECNVEFPSRTQFLEHKRTHLGNFF